MSKKEIGTIIELYSIESDVTLSIFVTNDFKADGKNSGYIQVGGNHDESKNCFWDNLDFFMEATNSEFKAECSGELKEKGFDVREVRKDIRRLIKRAFKLKILRPNDYLFDNSSCYNNDERQ